VRAGRSVSYSWLTDVSGAPSPRRFKEYLRAKPRAIEGGEINHAHASTLHVSQHDEGLIANFQLPGTYDLIIADESHRSIYYRYKDIFDHFDALFLG